MSLDSPDTVIKVILPPSATIEDVYNEFNEKIEGYRNHPNSSFDKLAKVLNFIPGLLLRWTVRFLRFLDYFGLLPRALTKLSPFHGSLFITSMGSLGIPAIYHHLYDFGTLPLFLSYGSIFTADAIKRDGSRERHHFVTFKVVTDERICDGYYYASCFKRIKRYLLHPELLDDFAQNVVEDID